MQYTVYIPVTRQWHNVTFLYGTAVTTISFPVTKRLNTSKDLILRILTDCERQSIMEYTYDKVKLILRISDLKKSKDQMVRDR